VWNNEIMQLPAGDEISHIRHTVRQKTLYPLYRA
jgi:hypothetical protein